MLVFQANVAIQPFSFDRKSWIPAFAGVTAGYISYFFTSNPCAW